MPVVSTTKLTARQYQQLGEDPAGVFLELVEGRIAVTPSRQYRHTFARCELLYTLQAYVETHDLGQVLSDLDTHIDAYTVRRPDVLFIRSDRLGIIDPDRGVMGPPDLCVEVTSPTGQAIDREDKFAECARLGVPNYWIIDPDPAVRSIDGYTLRDSAYRLVGSARGDESIALPPFDDLTIPLGKLWSPI